MSEPIVIWGAGAIGGTIGAYLQRAGTQVVFVDTVAEHVAAICNEGLHITGPIEEFSVTAPAVLPEELTGRFSTVFLCVKAHHTQEACEEIATILEPDGCVVSLQNGLNEHVIAKALGADRTVGAFVNFGADYLEPGIIHYAGHGAVVIGELDGRVTKRARNLHQCLQLFDGRAVLTDNIFGYLWGKMSYGALLYATALTNESIADVLACQQYRKTLISLAREVLAICAAAGVRPESFDGFDPSAFAGDDDNAASASLDELVAHNRLSAKSHSGVWRDLAVRKRPTEIDAQLGPMVQIASQHNIASPMILRLISLIHDIETGRRQAGMELIGLLEHDDDR